MQLPSSWTRARVKAGRFAPPAASLPGMPAIEFRVFQDRLLFNCILCQKWYLFRSFFGISLLGMDFFRDLYIGTGFLEPKIAPEAPPGRDIAGGSQKAAHLPLQQDHGC